MLADPPMPSTTTNTVRWQCLLHLGNTWCGDVRADYGSSETTVMEHHWEAWQLDRETPPFLFDHANWSHEIDLSLMTQTNVDTGSSRPIRRIMIMAR